MLLSFLIGVEQEGTVLTRVEVLRYGEEEVLVEFEAASELNGDLVHTVEELEEHRRAILVGWVLNSMPCPR